jgi:raffinose/stachyose/melibiose transport system substrate-binding protein
LYLSNRLLKRKKGVFWTMKKTSIALSTIVLTVGSLSMMAAPAFGASQHQARTSSQKVTVTLWSWTPIDTTMQQVVTKIEKKYPNINLQINIEPHPDYNIALKAAAGSGSLPDIIGLPSGSQTQEYRPYLQSLNSIAVNLWGSKWKTDFPQAAITQAQLGNPPKDNNFYMLPQETQVLNVWYNKKIFSQLHLSVPKTYQQLVADAHKISAAGYIPFYQGATQTNFDTWMFMELASQYNLKGMESAATGNGQWNTPAMVKAATVWGQMFTQHVFQAGALGDTQYPTGANLFAAGRVGMITLGSWWLQESPISTSPAGLKTMKEYGTFFFPAIAPGLKATPALGGIDFGWGITKNAAKSPAIEKATEMVLKEMISGIGEQESLNQLNDLPAFKGFKPTVSMPTDVMKLYNWYMKEIMVAHNQNIGNPTVEQALDTNLQAIGAGTETPQQAMDKVQAVAKTQG